jgi:pimeloyl-ACP methyl ester carboxylesterase
VKALAALLLWLAGAAAADAQSVGTPVPGWPVERHVLTDAGGREIVYYINRPAAPAPLLLMIQGSGCEPAMHLTPDGRGSYSTVYNFGPYAREGRFAVMIVEKPFAGFVGEATTGTATHCRPEFNRDFTAESWLAALQAALADARRLPFVEHRRTLLFGVSEGAVVAALLAGADPDVTDVISIGGSGTTQLFDFLVFAYQRCFDRSRCIAEVERQAAAIRAAPDSATDFAWGHPYRRWSSFFRADPGEALLRSRARVYLAFGTADGSVPPLSQELLGARLAAAGRDVTIRRVPDAGHSLAEPGASDFSGIDAEHRRALDWFWGRRP